MTRRLWRALTLAVLLGGISSGTVQAATIKLRPQGDAMMRAVQAALAQISTRDVPMILDATSGTTLTVGGVGASNAPFNPDVVARVVQVGGERRIEFNPQNPQGPTGLVDAVKQELTHELNLKEWTPAAAQLRFGGADLNGDGKIDLADLAILMANYGASNPAAGDLNQDRRVDDTDVRIFTAQYRANPDTTSSDAAATDTGTAGGSTTSATSGAANTATPPAGTNSGSPTPASPDAAIPVPTTSPTNPVTPASTSSAGTSTPGTATGTPATSSNSTGTGTNAPAATPATPTSTSTGGTPDPTKTVP